VKTKSTFLALCAIALVSGCATATDVTRSDGAFSGAKQGAGLALALGGGVMDETREGFATGAAIALVTLPVFALIGAATRALSVRK
jgi:hypothetical protein